MRWHSTPESLQEAKPSILAILETLGAMAGSLLIAYNLNSLKHIAIGSCIAPLLLLRSEKSSQLALNWADNIYKKTFWIWSRIDEYSLSYKFPLKTIAALFNILLTFIIAYFINILGFIIVKIITTAVIFFTHPIYTLRGFPNNWRQIALSTDFFSVPEIIPGIDSIDRSGMKLFIFRYSILESVWEEMHFDNITKKESISGKSLKIFYTFFYIVIFLFPCYVYRWSLKSTALIWSPLLWILRDPISGNLSFRLDQITKAAIYRASRYYSLFVIMMFSIKMYIWIAWQQIAETWQKIPGINTLNAYLVPQEIPIWHLCAVANAIGAWLLYFAADWFLQKYRHEQPVPENLIEKVLHLHTTIRLPLSLYTIACSLYITVNLGLQMKWPPLGAKLFPWQ